MPDETPASDLLAELARQWDALNRSRIAVDKARETMIEDQKTWNTTLQKLLPIVEDGGCRTIQVPGERSYYDHRHVRLTRNGEQLQAEWIDVERYTSVTFPELPADEPAVGAHAAVDVDPEEQELAEIGVQARGRWAKHRED